MEPQAWQERVKSWQQFSEWEKHHNAPKSSEEALHIVGDWLDFFLKRHPRQPESPDPSGIQKLQQRLSVLSKFE